MRRALVIVLALGGAAHAQSADEVQRARELYASAEAELKAGDTDAAIRDYGGSLELSKDPVLYYKIGAAYEVAGKCTVAISYYRRYLDLGKPEPAFVARTNERIAGCGGEATPGPIEPAGSGSAAPIAAEPSAGSAAPLPIVVSPSKKTAWLLASTSAGLATLGGILAYSARSARNDVIDLYAGTGGRPPVFDPTTKKRYDELLDEGHRYEHLSWASFGLAGAAAIGAAVLFYVHRDREDHPRVQPSAGGVSIAF